MNERTKEVNKLLSHLPNYQRQYILGKMCLGDSRLEILIRLVRKGIEAEGALSIYERRYADDARKNGVYIDTPIMGDGQ